MSEQLSPVLVDAKREPLPYFWVVQYRNAQVLNEPSGLTWSRDVDSSQVLWLALLPQLPGLCSHRIRIPAGAHAWFVRRTVKEGTLGVSGSEHQVALWTGIGWRYNAYGPSFFFNEQGHGVGGIDSDEPPLTDCVR